MSSRNRRRGWTPPVRAEIETDGRPSLEQQYFGGADNPIDHKLTQLCRQVEQAISLALISSADPVIRDLIVVAVEPVRGAALLRVLVATEREENDDDDDHDDDYDYLSDKLERARGYLCGEVARSIHRKRVPGLELVLVPLHGEEADDVDAE